MKCQNCGKQEANVKYTQIVNGVKKEMNLCESCAHELGITQDFTFNIPMDFKSLLGNFFGEYEDNFMPSLISSKNIKCDNCNTTYDEFINTGKFGCGECYEIFSEKIEPILKNLQGSNRHVGRKGRISNGKIKQKVEEVKEKIDNKHKEKSKIDKLKDELKQAIKEEKYEDAAKLRDEIKKLENE